MTAQAWNGSVIIALGLFVTSMVGAILFGIGVVMLWRQKSQPSMSRRPEARRRGRVLAITGGAIALAPYSVLWAMEFA